MRVWDVDCYQLCRKHLLGQHNEIHSIWNIITQGKNGYRNHPEVKRWQGHLDALWRKHNATAYEMTLRGYQHKSPLDANLAIGPGFTPESWQTIEKQIEILREKGCNCRV